MTTSKDKARDYRLRKVYGITLKDYESLLNTQGNVCWVCQKPPKKNLCVDHNHKTGEIRGLLCTYCNRYLVGRHRSPDLLLRIAAYISQGTGLFVPPKVKKKRKKKNGRRAKS